MLCIASIFGTVFSSYLCIKLFVYKPKLFFNRSPKGIYPLLATPQSTLFYGATYNVVIQCIFGILLACQTRNEQYSIQFLLHKLVVWGGIGSVIIFASKNMVVPKVHIKFGRNVKIQFFTKINQILNCIMT